MQPIQSVLKKSEKLGFNARCEDALKPTEPPIFCSLCGDQKKEFVSPANVAHPEPRLIVLDCECERRHKMLVEWMHTNQDIYGMDYAGWRRGQKAKDPDQDRHFRMMSDAQAELDRVTRLLER